MLIFPRKRGTFPDQSGKGPRTLGREAITETKRAFIDGEYGEQNTDPLRWAPFVYYGRE